MAIRGRCHRLLIQFATDLIDRDEGMSALVRIGADRHHYSWLLDSLSRLPRTGRRTRLYRGCDQAPIKSPRPVRRARRAAHRREATAQSQTVKKRANPPGWSRNGPGAATIR